MRSKLISLTVATFVAGCGPSVFDFEVPDEFTMNACGVTQSQLDDPAFDPDKLPPELKQTTPSRPRLYAQNFAKPWSSGRSLVVHGEQIIVADRGNDAVVFMDPASLNDIRKVATGGGPEQIVVGPDGSAYVSLRQAGQLARIDTKSGDITARWTVGVEPIGVAMSPSADYVFTVLAAENKLVALTPDGKVARTAIVGERPRVVAAVTEAGSGHVRLVIGHQSPFGSKAAGATVLMYEPGKGKIDFLKSHGTTVRLRRSNPGHGPQFTLQSSGSGNLKPVRVAAAAVNPDTGEVMLAHMLASPGTEADTKAAHFNKQTPTTKKSGGSSYGSGSGAGGLGCTSTPVRPMEVSMSAVGDDYKNGRVATSKGEHAIADPDTGRNILAAFDQPSDVNFHPTATLAFVTAMGTDNVLVLNTAEHDSMASPIAEIRVGEAPRAIDFSADGTKAYVLNGHDWTVSELDLSTLLAADVLVKKTSYKGVNGAHQSGTSAPQIKAVLKLEALAARTRKFGDDPLPEQLRLGRRIFHWSANPKLAKGGRFACASCHFEGGEDKQVWHIADGPRQTPSLAGRLAGTGPFNWKGTEDDLQGNMNKTIERMGGSGLADTELAALEQFMIHGLAEPPNPHRKSALTPDQEAGKKLFYDPIVGCGSCHGGTAGTDAMMWDVGTATSLEKQIAAAKTVRFNTPSLRSVWSTGPYLHDGSAKTLMDVLNRTAGKMGDVTKLTLKQKQQLVAYMLTL